MKKQLLISSLCAIAFSASSQFTPSRLAVYRVGDGTTITNNRTSAVFVDEYLTSSLDQTTPTMSLNIPVSTTGSNYRLTSIMRSSASAFQVEGMSGLSPDGNHLAIIGYDQETGATVTNSTIKVVGLINAAGQVNTSTTLAGSSPARAAIALNGGNAVYSSILSGGVIYSTIGSSSATLINSYVGNARSYTIFNNTLFCANNSTNVTYYNSLPTTAVSSRSGDIALSGILNINQIVLFASDGSGAPNIIYAVNDGANLADAGLHKYKMENNVWVAKGVIKIPGVTDGIKSVTGKVVGANIELYATTWGNLASPTVPSQLLKIIDLNAAGSTITNTANVPTVLATAPNNTIFRSVTFTPGTTPETTLPVKLTSFNGSRKQTGIALNWSTSSETDNSHFEILRATDNKNFVKIGDVKGNANSSSNQNYSFFDSRPQNSTNYYQLKQVDFNGESEQSKVISIAFNMNIAGLKVIKVTQQLLQLSFNSSSQGNAVVNVVDLNGRKLYTGVNQVSYGINDLHLPIQIPSGVYFVTVNTPTELLRTKFLK